MTQPSRIDITTPAVPDALAHLAQLVSTGKFAAARRAAATLLDQADPHSLALINRCAQALQADRNSATAALDEMWLAASNSDAAIITACMPSSDYVPDTRTTASEPEWRLQVRWVPPSRVSVRRGPITKPAPSGRDEPGYPDERDAVSADLDDRGLRLAPEELDYDWAAVPPLRGKPCLHCWIERSRADQPQCSWDDGLCRECRDAGAPGIPTPVHDFGRADAIRARCAFIASSDLSGGGGLPALRAEYRRATPAERVAIAAWVEEQHR